MKKQPQPKKLPENIIKKRRVQKNTTRQSIAEYMEKPANHTDDDVEIPDLVVGTSLIPPTFDMRLPESQSIPNLLGGLPRELPAEIITATRPPISKPFPDNTIAVIPSAADNPSMRLEQNGSSADSFFHVATDSLYYHMDITSLKKACNVKAGFSHSLYIESNAEVFNVDTNANTLLIAIPFLKRIFANIENNAFLELSYTFTEIRKQFLKNSVEDQKVILQSTKEEVIEQKNARSTQWQNLTPQSTTIVSSGMSLFSSNYQAPNVRLGDDNSRKEKRF